MSLDVYYSIRPVYHLSRLIFCWPFHYKNSKTKFPTFTEKIISTFLASLFLIILVWSLYNRNVSPRVKFNFTQSLLEDFATVSATLLVVITMLKKDCELFLQFFAKLKSIDKLLPFPEKYHREIHKYFTSKIIVQFTLVVLVILVDNYSWIKNAGISLTSYYINSYVMYLANNVIIAQVDLKVYLLRKRFEVLNENLTNHSAEIIRAKRKNVDSMLIRQSEETIRVFNTVFDGLCDLIELINKCYGIKIILLTFTIFTVLLNTLVIGFGYMNLIITVEHTLGVVMQIVWCLSYTVKIALYFYKVV